MKRSMALAGFTFGAGLLGRLTGPMRSAFDAWRAITWKQWMWTTAIGLVFVVAHFSEFLLFIWDWHWVLGGALTAPIAAYFFLLTVAVAEHGEPTRGQSPRRYVIAVLVAALAAPVAGRLTGMLLDVKDTTDPVHWVDAFIWDYTHTLLYGGLAVFIYVRLQADRRVRAAFDKAELERATASRQVLASRLATMQAQVEPRFLFNTLAQVEALYDRDPQNADRMLDDLIAYLRAALPQLRVERSTVDREAQLADAYLRIVQVRMGSRLDFAFDIPPDLADAGFPPMLLLPLIDNALRHGLEPLPLGGRIEVRARAEGKHLSLAVCDNGLGHAAKLIEGPGLTLLRERLHGLYGADAKLTLTSTQPQGVTATIEVPHEPPRDHR